MVTPTYATDLTVLFFRHDLRFSQPSISPSDVPSLHPSDEPSLVPSLSNMPTIIPTTIEVGTFTEFNQAITDSSTANGFDSSNVRTILLGPQAVTTRAAGTGIVFEDNIDIAEKHFKVVASHIIDLNGFKFTTGCNGAHFTALFEYATIENSASMVPSISPAPSPAETEPTFMPTAEPTEECREKDFGGAFFIRGDDSGLDPRLPDYPSYLEFKDCTLRHHSALDGGAIDSLFARMRFIRTHFVGNRATYNGGAVLANYGFASFFACKFEDNTAGVDGGALYVAGGEGASINTRGDSLSPPSPFSPAQPYTEFLDNRAGRAGGAIFTETTLLTIGLCETDPASIPSNVDVRCAQGALFRSNHAGSYGGALAIWSMVDFFVSFVAESKFIDNSAGILGGAVNAYARPDLAFPFTIYRSTFNGNTPDDVFDDSRCDVCSDPSNPVCFEAGQVILRCNQEEQFNTISSSFECDGEGNAIGPLCEGVATPPPP